MIRFARMGIDWNGRCGGLFSRQCSSRSGQHFPVQADGDWGDGLKRDERMVDRLTHDSEDRSPPSVLCFFSSPSSPLLVLLVAQDISLEVWRCRITNYAAGWNGVC